MLDTPFSWNINELWKYIVGRYLHTTGRHSNFKNRLQYGSATKSTIWDKSGIVLHFIVDFERELQRSIQKYNCL